MSANPHANGGLLMRELDLPDIAAYAVKVEQPGADDAEATAVMARLLARRHERQRGATQLPPVWTGRDRLQSPFASSSRRLTAPGTPRRCPMTSTSRRDGRVMEILSEHTCQGWLEGYLLTGRHGLFNCYEAFIHIVDSMFNQHAKWLKSLSRDSLAAARSRRSTIS